MQQSSVLLIDCIAATYLRGTQFESKQEQRF
jgi:hypothetical protein